MKRIKKKSADNAVNELLLDAYYSKTPLAWDRSEKQQPQCGFAKLCACCTDCADGPCRISPFEKGPQAGVCGKTADDMALAAVSARFTDGILALASLADENGICTKGLAGAVAVKDSMGCADFGKIGAYGAGILKELAGITKAAEGESAAGTGLLAADKANVLVMGFVNKAEAEALKNADVNVVTSAGNEFTDGYPVLTNNVSAEAMLISGAVDAVLAGTQCVSPALKSLAAKKGICVTGSAAEAAEKAAEHLRSRVSSAVHIPEGKTKVVLCGDLADAAKEAKDIVFLCGCGKITETQDYEVTKEALELVNKGTLVVTAGCLGTSLAKAGLCDPGFNGGDYPLSGKVPAPVLHLGSCTAAGEVLNALSGKITSARFIEASQSKMYAIALAFAAEGIPVQMNDKQLFHNPAVKECLAAAGIKEADKNE